MGKNRHEKLTCTRTKKRFFQRFQTFFPKAHRYLPKHSAHTKTRKQKKSLIKVIIIIKVLALRHMTHLRPTFKWKKKESSFWCPPEGVAYFPVFFPPAIRDKKRGQRTKKPSKKGIENPQASTHPAAYLPAVFHILGFVHANGQFDPEVLVGASLGQGHLMEFRLLGAVWSRVEDNLQIKQKKKKTKRWKKKLLGFVFFPGLLMEWATRLTCSSSERIKGNGSRQTGQRFPPPLSNLSLVH